MKKIKFRKSLILFGMMGLLLSGCSSSKNYDYETSQSDFSANYLSGSASKEAYDMNMMEMEMPAESYEVETEEGYGNTTTETSQINTEITTPAVTDNRKLIKNVYLNIETKEYDQLTESINKQISSMGGYVQEASSGTYTYNNARNAHYIIRIPADQLNTFVNNMSKEGNVTSKTETTEDITLQYVDMESHKKSLVIEQERLLALLEKADKLKDIIALEERLSQVRYQLEYFESQLRTYDNLVSYSTVTLDVYEVERETKVDDVTVVDRIKTGLGENVYNLKVGLENFFVWFVSNIPNFIFIIILIAFILFIIKVTKVKDRLKAKTPKNRNVKLKGKIEEKNQEAQEKNQDPNKETDYKE